MNEFSSLGEFGQMSKPNHLIEEEKQVFGHQSLPSEPAEAELQNDTIDLGSVDNLVNKPVQFGNEISDVSERVNTGLRFELGVENQGEGARASGKREHSGMNKNADVKFFSEGGDVSLEFDHMLAQQEEGAYLSVDNLIHKPLQTSNVISDYLISEGVDASLGFKDDLENQGECAHLSGKGQQAGFNENAVLKASSEGVDVSIKLNNPIDKPAQIVFSEEADMSLKFEHGSGNQEGVDAGLKSEHMSEDPGEGAHVSMRCEQPELKEDADLEAELDDAKTELIEEGKDGKLDSSQREGAHISMVEQVENLQSDMLICGTPKGYDFVIRVAQANPIEKFSPPSEMQNEKQLVVVLAIPADSCEKPRLGPKPKAVSVKMGSPQQLSLSAARALRSRSKENLEDCEPSADLETRKGSTERRRRKKGKQQDGKSNDEFAKMRKHLKYLLHRIQYEQNLLDAYSNEGWRGQSIEKLRPEKELQRAKADINRSKLKIRDLFKRLESMFSEGKFPESLYDSDGLIDSEDIFCAKCGSKDSSPGNDILLCDGICDRGFHQNCLNPPLATEEIPPGDEGWLCPACDCKVDCYNFLNDSHGTKLTIEDSWEKVFPEAVATMAGNELDDIMGLPSDDSEDNEYNPDGADDDSSIEGNESSSDESDESDSSDFSSVSEDLGAIHGAEQNLGIPSDDSEDDEDFDPDAPNVNEDGVELGSSGTDFTSASEDLGAAIGGEGTSDQDELPVPLESEQDLGESSPITGKRCAERLDYKKLYDETFGNAASDSSDDEEWTDMVPTRKRKSSTEITCASASADGTCGSDAPRRRGQLKANSQTANRSPAKLQENSQNNNSADSSKRRPPNNRLGEAVTKRLYEVFKENKYPDRETKEKLAHEVGLTLYKVDKWFGNARWSLHHHPSRVEASMQRSISSSSTPHSVACNGVETTATNDGAALPEGGCADTNAKKLTPRRRREITEGNQSTLENSLAENSKEETLSDPLQAPEMTQRRVLRKRRKSGA